MGDLYIIKPLEWAHRIDRDGGWTWWAVTIFCTLHVERDSEGTCHWSFCVNDYDRGFHDCESVEDGIRLADEWYRARLLPALEKQGATK